MSATAIVVRLLLDDSAVTAGVHAIVIPQEATMPAITVNLVSEQQDHVIEGAQPVFDSRVSVACHAETVDGVIHLGEAVKKALEGTILWEVDPPVSHHMPAGVPAPTTWYGSATICKAGSDVTDWNEDRTVFRRILDWRVRWQRTDI